MISGIVASEPTQHHGAYLCGGTRLSVYARVSAPRPAPPHAVFFSAEVPPGERGLEHLHCVAPFNLAETLTRQFLAFLAGSSSASSSSCAARCILELMGTGKQDNQLVSTAGTNKRIWENSSQSPKAVMPNLHSRTNPHSKIATCRALHGSQPNTTASRQCRGIRLGLGSLSS